MGIEPKIPSGSESLWSAQREIDGHLVALATALVTCCVLLNSATSQGQLGLGKMSAELGMWEDPPSRPSW